MVQVMHQIQFVLVYLVVIEHPEVIQMERGIVKEVEIYV